MAMQNETRDEKYLEALEKIAKSFYQAYRLSGTVSMTFGVRLLPDSDGNSVVDVYLSPRDQEAASTLNQPEDDSRHMQFLESMVPAGILGYRFELQIIPQGPNDIQVELVKCVAPLSY